MQRGQGANWVLRLAIVVSTIVVGSAGLAQSEPPAPAARDLHEAVDIAIRLSPDAASLPALRDQASALARAGRGPFAGPPVAAGDVLTRGSGSIEQEVSVSAGLRWPGEGRAIRSWGANTGRAADSGFAAAQLRIAGEVRDAWWALAGARAMVAVNRDQLAIATTTGSQVARLEADGEESRRDLLLARSETAAAAARLSQAEAELARAEAAYAALAGAPPNDLTPEILTRRSSIEDHPALRAASDRAIAADARARALAYGARIRPEGQVGARRERIGPGQGSATSLLLGIRVPLGRNQLAVADASGARSEALAAVAEAARLRARLIAEQAAAQRRLGSAQTALDAAEARRSALAQSFALTQKGQREGEIGFIEALRARQTLSEAERDLAAAKVAYDAAISAFNQAMGVLP